MLVADDVQRAPARILFDSGSQRSYITKKAAEPLALDGPSEVPSVSRRQRGRVVRAPDLKSGGHGFKSRSDLLAGVVSRWTLVQLLGHACK